MAESNSEALDSVSLATEVVSAFVSNNSTPVAELPTLIASVHSALVGIANGSAVPRRKNQRH